MNFLDNTDSTEKRTENACRTDMDGQFCLTKYRNLVNKPKIELHNHIVDIIPCLSFYCDISLNNSDTKAMIEYSRPPHEFQNEMIGSKPEKVLKKWTHVNKYEASKMYISPLLLGLKLLKDYTEVIGDRLNLNIIATINISDIVCPKNSWISNYRYFPHEGCCEMIQYREACSLLHESNMKIVSCLDAHYWYFFDIGLGFLLCILLENVERQCIYELKHNNYFVIIKRSCQTVQINFRSLNFIQDSISDWKFKMRSLTWDKEHYDILNKLSFPWATHILKVNVKDARNELKDYVSEVFEAESYYANDRAFYPDGLSDQSNSGTFLSVTSFVTSYNVFHAEQCKHQGTQAYETNPYPIDVYAEILDLYEETKQWVVDSVANGSEALSNIHSQYMQFLDNTSTARELDLSTLSQQFLEIDYNKFCQMFFKSISQTVIYTLFSSASFI